MKPSDAVSTNLAAWEEAAPHLKAKMHAHLLERFREPGYSSLVGVRLSAIQQFDVKGKAVAQLCCNNGREILSIKNLGAGYCVGFDLSQSLISQARELAQAGGIDCAFMACDVHKIPDDFTARFDLVIVTSGSLRWMPEVDAFMRVASRLLKRGGVLFINEIHPILDSFAKSSDGRTEWKRSYFHDGPIVSRDAINYQCMKGQGSKPHVWYHHKLSDIVTSVVRHRMELVLLRELEENVSGAYDFLVPTGIRPPFSYVLAAHKKAQL